MSKVKFYVVWIGRKPGIYNSWPECQAQVMGFEKALYKSFPTRNEAETAYKQNPWSVMNKKTKTSSSTSSAGIIPNSLSVDAACSGNPGKMEYRGVHVTSKEEWFLMEFPLGTNNIGEFLAIVHALSVLNRRNINIPIYTDSATALAWIRKKKCGSKLEENAETASLFEFIRRAEKWLHENKWTQPLLKWDTKKWGEIPADFGRK